MTRILFRLDYIDSHGATRNYAVNLSYNEALMMAGDVLTDEGYVSPIPEKVMIERHYGVISTLKASGDSESGLLDWQKLALKGHMIDAIKALRASHGKVDIWSPSLGKFENTWTLGLKEAKDRVQRFVDAFHGRDVS